MLFDEKELNVFDNNEWYVYTKVNDGKPVKNVLEGNK